jgi:hypothetical protein
MTDDSRALNYAAICRSPGPRRDQNQSEVPNESKPKIFKKAASKNVLFSFFSRFLPLLKTRALLPVTPPSAPVNTLRSCCKYVTLLLNTLIPCYLYAIIRCIRAYVHACVLYGDVVCIPVNMYIYMCIYVYIYVYIYIYILYGYVISRAVPVLLADELVYHSLYQ